ncbi:MAG: crossover junction endodeoxyribonuclease RuvC [Pirellulales bacterium]
MLRQPAHSPTSPATGLRVLGIDPGLNITGYGVLEVALGGPVLCEAGVVRGRTRDSLTARLAEIYDGVREVIDTFRPCAMALEQLYGHYKRPRTSILMGHARGVICLAAQQAGVPVVHYGATQVKKTLTGSGRAGKSQIQRAVQQELRLKQLIEPHDVSDALAIALCHYYLEPEWAALARRKGGMGEGAKGGYEDGGKRMAGGQ